MLPGNGKTRVSQIESWISGAVSAVAHTFCRPVDVRSKQRVFGKMKQERSTVYRVHPDNQPSKGIAELSTVRVLASYLRQEQTVQNNE